MFLKSLFILSISFSAAAGLVTHAFPSGSIVVPRILGGEEFLIGGFSQIPNELNVPGGSPTLAVTDLVEKTCQRKSGFAGQISRDYLFYRWLRVGLISPKTGKALYTSVDSEIDPVFAFLSADAHCRDEAKKLFASAPEALYAIFKNPRAEKKMLCTTKEFDRPLIGDNSKAKNVYEDVREDIDAKSGGYKLFEYAISIGAESFRDHEKPASGQPQVLAQVQTDVEDSAAKATTRAIVGICKGLDERAAQMAGGIEFPHGENYRISPVGVEITTRDPQLQKCIAEAPPKLSKKEYPTPDFMIGLLKKGIPIMCVTTEIANLGIASMAAAGGHIFVFEEKRILLLVGYRKAGKDKAMRYEFYARDYEFAESPAYSIDQCPLIYWLP